MKPTETIMLQFVDEAGIVKRFSALDWGRNGYNLLSFYLTV